VLVACVCCGKVTAKNLKNAFMMLTPILRTTAYEPLLVIKIMLSMLYSSLQQVILENNL